MKLRHSYLLLPAILYYAVVAETANNLPKWDDYDGVLAFLVNWHKGDLGQKMHLLWTQYNEHRIVWSRLIFLFTSWIFGGVNFKALIWIADLQLIPVGLLLAHFIRKSGIKYWPVAAMIALLCLFDLNTYESGSIAFDGMQNYGTILLFFSSLYFYDRGKPIPAVISQALLILSSGNGMIGSVCLVGFSLIRRKHGWPAAATAGIFTVLYFVGYVWVKQPGALPWNASTAITYLVRMAGAYFDFDSSFLFGLAILGVTAAIIPWSRIKQFAPFLTILAFTLSSMTTAAIFRSCLKDAQFQTSRYLIYPQLLVACAGIFAVLQAEKAIKYRRPRVFLPLVITLYSFRGNYAFGKAGFQRTRDRSNTRQFYHPDPKAAAEITKQADEAGIYSIEDNR